MTERDRLEAAICTDSPVDIREAQLAEVQRVLRERGACRHGDAVEQPSLAEDLCSKCLHPLDETGFCEMCGRLERSTQ